MYSWNDNYKLGVPKIDEQHRRLFELAEELFVLYKDEFCFDKYDRIIQQIGELKDYTIFHFDTEESYMREIGYKKYLSHKVDHDDFIKTVNNIDMNMIDEGHDQFIFELLEFVTKWISDHILEKDMLIVAK